MKKLLIFIAVGFVMSTLLGCAMQMPSQVKESKEIDPSAGRLTSVQFYIPSEEENKISILDIQSGEIVGDISVGEVPTNVVFDSTMRTAYVANQTSGTIGVIDTQKLEMTAEIEVGPLPHGLVLTPDNSTLYVATVGDQFVDVIDVKAGAVKEKIDLGNGAKSNYVSLFDQTLFVTDHEQQKVYIIDVESSSVSQEIDTHGTPRVLRLNEDGTSFYVAAGGKVQQFQTSDGSLMNEWSVPEGATDFVISEPAGKMAVTSMEANTVSLIDLSTNEVTTIENLSGARHIALNRLGTKAYITLRDSGEVAILNMEAGDIEEKIKVGNSPHGIQIKALPGIGGSC